MTQRIPTMFAETTVAPTHRLATSGWLRARKSNYFRLIFRTAACDSAMLSWNGCLFYNILFIGKTYSRGTELAHVGACMKITPDNSCPESCPDQRESDLPVCGSDGNVYRTQCEMKKFTCGQHVIPVALHHCTATESCNTQCDRKVQSVCGSDGKIYRNLCEMRGKNCGYWNNSLL